MAKKAPEPKTPKPEDGLLTRVKDDVKDYISYARPYHKNWEGYWQLYNNRRIKRAYFGTSDSFDPMTHQMVETAVDNVYGSRPRLTFIRRQPEQECETDLLNAMWNQSWDYSDMDLNIMPIGREEEVTGNVVIFCGWEAGYMTMKHVPVRDVIFDHAASNPKNMKHIGYRRLALLEDLKKEERFDPEAGEKDENGVPRGAWVKKYTIPDDLKTWSTSGEDKTDAEVKECYNGSTLSDHGKSKQVEVIYMAYQDKIVEVANRSAVIFEEDNNFHKDSYDVEVQLHNDDGEAMYDESSLPQGVSKTPDGQVVMPDGSVVTPDEFAKSLAPVPKIITVPEIKPFLPFAMGRGAIDTALLLAKGSVEVFADTQEDLNDEINIKKDNLIYRQQNIGLVDKHQPELIQQLAQAKPGSLIPADLTTDPVKWNEKPEVAADSDIEITRLKQVVRDSARIDQVTQGVSTDNSRTATEINAQVAGATSGFSTKTRNLESGLYKQLGELFVRMVQIFATEEQVVRIEGKDGSEQFKKFEPNKYWGSWDVKVVLESTAKAKQTQEMDKTLSFYKLAQGNPNFDQRELIKFVAQRAFDLDHDDLDVLLAPPAPPMQPGMPMPGAPGTPADQPMPPMNQPVAP